MPQSKTLPKVNIFRNRCLILDHNTTTLYYLFLSVRRYTFGIKEALDLSFEIGKQLRPTRSLSRNPHEAAGSTESSQFVGGIGKVGDDEGI